VVSRLRIGVMGFIHESNTFVSFPTTLQQFTEEGISRGDEILGRWTGAHHELSGFIAGGSRNGFEVAPLIASHATPGGPLTKRAFEAILGEMTGLLESEDGLDGLLLALHGAMVAEGYQDADGEVTLRLREIFDKPIVMTLDCHANVSLRMVQSTTATILYRSNPHVDQRARGLEAANIIARTVRGEIHPVQALETPPLVINTSKQYTSLNPARSLIRDAEQSMSRPRVISASVGLGFAFADVEKMGSSFLVVADSDPSVARGQARWMAKRAWKRRQEFLMDLPSSAEAVRMAAGSKGFPVVLMDVGDNVGGGSPGDSTFLLEELLEQGTEGALVVLWDPDEVQRCVEVGVGADVRLDVGGKSDGLHGCPISVQGVVTAISDGRFTDDKPRHGGQRLYDQGLTAVIEKRIIVVKGVIAPRAAY
jgi:microcystin degradation protein MlrC